ncbi:MAG: hypothetical protein ACM357_08790, partial [Gemmatimonadota bacterium]
MSKDAEFMGIQAGHGRLLCQRYLRAELVHQIGASPGCGAEYLTAIRASAAGYEFPPFEAVDEAGNPGGPLQELVGNVKRGK